MQKKFAQKLIELSDIFVPYKVYPVSKYVPQSPLRCFQQLYPEDYYSSQIESFLKVHTYEPAQRGADLPWWGSRYFTDTQGYRVVIVSQDSNEKDAGSVVFYACLYSPIPSEEEYKKFSQCLGKKKVFRYNSSWKKIYNQLIEWKINLDFCYVTDASKVYKESSWKDKDFDKKKSRILLERELEYCKPDLLILLGSVPLHLLKKDVRYRDVVGTQININGLKCIVSPFLTGNAPAQPDFKNRLENASKLIISQK